MLFPPPPHTYTYHFEYLALADQIEKATGKPILNPRLINAESLEVYDLQFRSDLEQYRREIQYRRDVKRRPSHMR